MPTDILITAPLPPFLYEPLKSDYRCHDYVQSKDKAGLLAAEGGRIRGLVQGGGTVTPTELLEQLPKLEIISVFGVGYDGVPVAYWEKRGPELTTKLAGRKVGILGLGRIGKAIAERVRAMGMKVAYTGRKPQDVPYEYVRDLKALAAAVDFLVVACPGGEATRNIVNADVLAALGKKGTLINIARGSIVDEPALVAALKASV